MSTGNPVLDEILARNQAEEGNSKLDEILNRNKKAPEEVNPLNRVFRNGPLGFLNKAAGRFVPDAMEAYEDTAELLSHPVETAKAIGGAVGDLFMGGQRGLVNKGVEAVESIIEDPAQVADAIAEHPFDTVAAFHSGGASLGKRPIKNVINRGANSAYRRDLQIPRSAGAEGREMAEFGIEKGLTARRGYNAALAAQERLNEQLNAIVTGRKDDFIPLEEITGPLNKLKREFADSYDEFKAFKVIDDRIDQLNARYGEAGGLTLEQAHRFKVDAYNTAYDKMSTRKVEGKRNPGKKERTARDEARSAKESIQERAWNYGPINKEWQGYAKLRPFLQQSMDRKLFNTDALFPVVRDIVKKMVPGSKAAIVMNRMADPQWMGKYVPELITKYTPQQIKYMVSKVDIDTAAAGLWASGQFDRLLTHEEGE